MLFKKEEDSLEHTSLVVWDVFMYKNPLRSSTDDYKCGERLQSNKICSNCLSVISCKYQDEIHLEDPNSGELFVTYFIHLAQWESSIKPTIDSSRYFVLKIEEGHGKHTFIGLASTSKMKPLILMSHCWKKAKQLGAP